MLQQYRATLFELQHATFRMQPAARQLQTLHFVAATESLDSKMCGTRFFARPSLGWLLHHSHTAGTCARPPTARTLPRK